MNDATPFIRIVRRRRSCRRYDLSRPVSRELLRECAEAARLAPSACNSQPCRLIVVDHPANVEAIRRSCRLPGIPHPWWDQVPVFVALCAERSMVAHRIGPAVTGIPYHLIDLGIAGEHFVLAATENGLGTCWIGWFRARPLRKLLHIPRNVAVLSLISVGYPAAETASPQDEPDRIPLSNLLRWNNWGNMDLRETAEPHSKY